MEPRANRTLPTPIPETGKAAGRRRHSVRITILLIVAVASLVTLSTGLVLMLSGRAALRNTVELLHASAELIIERLEDDVRGHVAPAGEIVGYISRLVAQGDIDPADREQLGAALMGATAGVPQIAGVVFVDHQGNALRVSRNPQGSGVSGTPTPVDRAFTERLAIVRQTGTMDWHPPMSIEGSTYVYVAGPVYRDERYHGALIAGVAIDELSSFVDDLGRRLGLTAFILYGDRHVLAHPELKQANSPVARFRDGPLLPVGALEDAVLRSFWDNEPADDHGIENLSGRRIETDSGKYFAMSRRLTDLGEVPWHVGVYAPLDSIDDQVRRLVGSMLAGLGVLGLAIVCAVFLARYIARPILKIAASAEQIGRFELDDIEPLDRSRIKELDEQATAFNRMLDGLRWFETYVPKNLVARLMAGHAGAAIVSREQEVTVMFTDIIGFTAMTETMPPGDVAGLLNEHFEAVGSAIESEQGTLDKYIGDAVMAFWGAPDCQPDHAVRACRAALRIRETLDGACENGIVRPPIRLKIAIHTGRLLVGNIGAKRRMNYTVIGDTVNTCSRIETICSTLDAGEGSCILVSEETADQARGTAGLEFHEAGKFPVKGRRRNVRLYRLSGTVRIAIKQPVPPGVR